MASVVGCLCSPFNVARKQFHRVQNSKMKLLFFNPDKSNAKENLLLCEYEKTVKQCKDSVGKSAVGLSVSLTDLYAKNIRFKLDLDMILILHIVSIL
eukprot:UN00583